MKEYQLPKHWDGNCFGCSSKNEKGLQLEFWMMDSACHTHFKVPEYMCGFDNLTHGGIIALMMDEVAQWTLIGALGRMGVTRDLSVRYRRPVPTETELVVEGRILDESENNVLIGLSIMDADGTVLADGESNYAMADLAKIAEISGSNEEQLREFLSKYPVSD